MGYIANEDEIRLYRETIIKKRLLIDLKYDPHLYTNCRVCGKKLQFPYQEFHWRWKECDFCHAKFDITKSVLDMVINIEWPIFRFSIEPHVAYGTIICEADWEWLVYNLIKERGLYPEDLGDAPFFYMTKILDIDVPVFDFDMIGKKFDKTLWKWAYEKELDLFYETP